MLPHQRKCSRNTTLLAVAVVSLLAFFLTGCGDSAKLGEYETRETTNYMVLTLSQTEVSHFLLPEHQDVQAVLQTATGFTAGDLSQSWVDLDWTSLRPFVATSFDLNRPHNAEGYMVNQLETRFRRLDVASIAFRLGRGDGSSQLQHTHASVAGKLALSYMQASSEWLARNGAELNAEYTFDMTLNLMKVSNRWRVTSVSYYPNPARSVDTR